MKSLFFLVVMAAGLLAGSGASAHCDQNHGHQGASNAASDANVQGNR